MTTARKQPQDRLAPKATTEEQPRPEGWELLKPFDEVPVWDQLELVEIVKPLIPPPAADGKPAEVEIDLNSIDLRIIGELAKKLREFAVEEKAYVDFVSGSKGMERAMGLGIEYAMQMGESERSATS